MTLTLNVIREEFHAMIYIGDIEHEYRLIKLVPIPEVYGKLACDRSGRLYVLRDDKWKEQRANTLSEDYVQFNARFGDFRVRKRAHILIAMTYVPNPDNKKFVDHINRIKNDNRVENLRWVTTLENNLNRRAFIIDDHSVPKEDYDRYLKFRTKAQNILDDYYSGLPFVE